MQGWIPARGSGIAVLRALPIIACLAIQPQRTFSFEDGIVFVRPGASSTLDGRVTPQEQDFGTTIEDFVRPGILTKKPLPQLNAPKLQAPKTDASAAPLKDIDSAARPLPKPSQSGKTAPTKASPFSKWIKPEGATGDAPSDQVAAPATDAPKVTRLPRRNTPSPKTSTDDEKNTAVASDLSKLVQDDAKPLKSSKSEATPKPSNYPPPSTDKTAPRSIAKNLPPLTRSQINLRTKVRKVLTHYYNRPLNTRDRSPWELMHAMLAFEAHSKVLQGGPNGEPITAVGWLCYNQACKRRTLMYVDEDDELRVRVGPALQGHRGQLLAMLAQSRINRNYPMLVERKELTISDLIEMEKRTCYPRTELTFKLIGLMHYLDSDEKWMNDQGMEWDIPRMISEELRQPVRGAACGGTHRLAGLTLAYKTRIKRGEPVDGEYLRAQRFVTRYQKYAYRLQNRDGSFSTEWFRGPGDKDDIDRKLKTTGHILEWLLYAATEKELKHWKTTKAANYLANIMLRNRYRDWEAGPLGHAIHALFVYDRLVFGPYDPPEVLPMAEKPTTKNTRR